MNKIPLLVVCLVLRSIISAQSNISMGVSVGGNFSTITDSSDNNLYKPGFNGGLFLIYGPTENWGIGAELKYSMEGTKYESILDANNYTKSTTTLNYLRLPIRITYFFGSFEDNIRPKLFIGPTLGFLLGGDIETEVSYTDVFGNNIISNSTIDAKDDIIGINGFDLGIHGGAGVNIRLTEGGMWLNVDALYTMGLTDVYENDNIEGKNRNISLNLGLAFPFGSEGD